ncbi:MAG: tripartite tricarboxylate transporter TctB family protein [Planctomycetales bacterium]|nr:tripartite tricarboxylate transporter TctB family protein [Planctomycetales bacterium]
MLIFLLLAVFSGCGRETHFPDRPITLICPWSAGGGTDRVSRQVAAQLEEVLGTPVNVINATGGSGVTGHTRGALARPDGYTLTMVTVELNMLHWRGLTSLTYQDFAPIQLLNRDAAAIFVRSDSPLASLDDLQADVESRPGQVKASGTAFGGIWHVALAGWLNSRGIDPTAATWISINGAGPSLQELNASGVDFVCCSLPEADALLASKLVRCLGVMADERVPGFLDVPTFREQGHDWSIAGWRGIAAPKAIAADRLQVLVDALQEIAESDDYLQFMANAGFNVSLEGPDAFAATLKRQDEQFNEVLTGPAFAAISDEHFGPMLFPAVTALLLVLSIASVLWTSNTSPTETAANPAHFGKIGLVLCAAIFYLFVSEWLGFILAATIMLAALMALFRVRLAIALPFATALSLCVYQVFAVGLRVPLPRGILGW